MPNNNYIKIKAMCLSVTQKILGSKTMNQYIKGLAFKPRVLNLITITHGLESDNLLL